MCSTTRQSDRELKETFYIGHEPLINVIQKSVNDKYSNKILHQISSIDHCGDFSKRAAVVCIVNLKITRTYRQQCSRCWII